MSVTLLTGRYDVSASLELADKVENLGRGIGQYTEAAELTPSDDTWIQETIAGISDALRETVKRREMRDADIPIPEEVYKNAWSQDEKEKLKNQYRAKYRDHRPWVLYQASFLRDCQRLVTQAAFTRSQSVIQARRQIAAFAAVISSLLGGTTLKYDSE